MSKKIKILYINSNPKPIEESETLQISEYYVDKFKKDSKYEVTELKLYDTSFYLPDMNTEFFKMYKEDKNNLSFEHKIIWDRKLEISEQFKASDYVIVAIPLWAALFPMKFKLYIDLMAHPGITFINDNGNIIGQLKNKYSVIQASGGIFDSRTNLGILHIQRFLGWLGSKEMGNIYVENTDVLEWDEKQIKIYRDKADELFEKVSKELN